MKTDLLKVRISAPEKAGFKEAADIAGLGLSAWARERLRRIAVRELEDAGQEIPFLQRESE